MELSLDLIRTYGFKEDKHKPDWDDVAIDFTLDNGIVLGGLIVCFNEPCELDSLEGMEGFIYIETKEELDKINSMTYEEVCYMIAEENSEFNIEDYL